MHGFAHACGLLCAQLLKPSRGRIDLGEKVEAAYEGRLPLFQRHDWLGDQLPLPLPVLPENYIRA
jgi:hypothetical protein